MVSLLVAGFSLWTSLQSELTDQQAAIDDLEVAMASYSADRGLALSAFARAAAFVSTPDAAMQALDDTDAALDRMQTAAGGAHRAWLRLVTEGDEALALIGGDFAPEVEAAIEETNTVAGSLVRRIAFGRACVGTARALLAGVVADLTTENLLELGDRMEAALSTGAVPELPATCLVS